MSNFFTLLTKIGAAAWINAQGSGTTVSLTHLAVGDGNGVPITPSETMTTLVHEVHRVPISSVTADVENPNWLVIEAVLPTEIGGWTVREMGLIGGPGSSLLAVGNFPETYKPQLAEGSGRDMVLRMVIQVSNTAVVNLTVDPSVALATNQSIVNAMAAHEAKADPHPQYRRLATTAQTGIVRLAMVAEARAMASHELAVTPAGLAQVLGGHEAASDPHSQYLNEDRLNARLSADTAERFFFANF